MKVDLYTIVWNEAEMLPFFFRHYDPVVDRYIVYDDGSTDGTLDILAAHDRVEVRRFVRTEPESYVLSAWALYDGIWKESRGRADWVIITAVDEHLYHPAGLRNYLERVRAKGITAVPATAFQMVTDSFPAPQETLAETRRLGEPFDKYNKLSIFNPTALRRTGYRIGRHRAAPEGYVRYPKQDEVLLFHYKFLGLNHLLRRYALLASGLGPTDRLLKLGHHYELPRKELEQEFQRLRGAARDVTGQEFDGLERKKWWRAKETKLAERARKPLKPGKAPKPVKPPKPAKVPRPADVLTGRKSLRLARSPGNAQPERPHKPDKAPKRAKAAAGKIKD